MHASSNETNKTIQNTNCHSIEGLDNSKSIRIKNQELLLGYTQRNILATHKYSLEINVTSHLNNASIGLYLFSKLLHVNLLCWNCFCRTS